MGGSDSKLVCTRDGDGRDLYMEDVFDVFRQDRPESKLLLRV